MTDTPIVNDLDAILARANACRNNEFASGYVIGKDVPSMAAEILSLRAQVAKRTLAKVIKVAPGVGDGVDCDECDGQGCEKCSGTGVLVLDWDAEESLAKKRLDVLEELRANGRLQLFRLEKGMVGVALSADAENAKVLVFDSFTSCGNDELSRREKENG